MDSLLPFLQGFCNPYNMPVYPGAPWIVAQPNIEPKSGSSTVGRLLPVICPELRNLPFSSSIRGWRLCINRESPFSPPSPIRSWS